MHTTRSSSTTRLRTRRPGKPAPPGRRRIRPTPPTPWPRACGPANPARSAVSWSPRCPATRRRPGWTRSGPRATPKKAREALAVDEARAWADLRRARDSVVGLGALAVREGGLAAAWEALATWAAREHTERSQGLPELEVAASALRQEIVAATTALAGLLSEHGIAGVTDPAQALGEVADHLARARADLDRVRRDREEAARLDEQVQACREDEQVATELGRLLRSDRFERWLCGEALDSLVAEASVTLMELSGQQYELD